MDIGRIAARLGFRDILSYVLWNEHETVLPTALSVCITAPFRELWESIR